MPSKYAQQTVSTDPLVGPIEALLRKLNLEIVKALREVRERVNGIVKEYNDGSVALGTSGLTFSWGAGAPTVAAASGSIYLRTDGGAGTTLYVREGAVWTPK